MHEQGPVLVPAGQYMNHRCHLWAKIWHSCARAARPAGILAILASLALVLAAAAFQQVPPGLVLLCLIGSGCFRVGTGDNEDAGAVAAELACSPLGPLALAPLACRVRRS